MPVPLSVLGPVNTKEIVASRLSAPETVHMRVVLIPTIAEPEVVISTVTTGTEETGRASKAGEGV